MGRAVPRDRPHQSCPRASPRAAAIAVFTTTEGRPIEPKAFASRYWYRCLRALGIRVRGIYATKDTFVTTARQANVRVARLEAQTGVAYATLKRHCGKWITPEGTSELERFVSLDPTLFGDAAGSKLPQGTALEGQFTPAG
jgi:hypothetical protein